MTDRARRMSPKTRTLVHYRARKAKRERRAKEGRKQTQTAAPGSRLRR